MATRLVSMGRISMGHTDRTTSITCVEVSNESVLRSEFFVTPCSVEQHFAELLSEFDP